MQVIRKNNQYGYRHIMGIAEEMLDSEELDAGSKIDLLDYLMRVVKTDLQASILAFSSIRISSLTKEQEEVLTDFIPVSALDEKGNIVKAETEVKTLVDFSKDCIFSTPWKISSMQKAVLHVAKNKFLHEPNNQTGYYFTCLDMGCISNGHHHISAAIARRSGITELTVVEIQKLFPHLKTDGKHWINTHTNLPTQDPVKDYRVLALFELSRKKYYYQLEFRKWRTSLKDKLIALYQATGEELPQEITFLLKNTNCFEKSKVEIFFDDYYDIQEHVDFCANIQRILHKVEPDLICSKNIDIESTPLCVSMDLGFRPGIT